MNPLFRVVALCCACALALARAGDDRTTLHVQAFGPHDYTPIAVGTMPRVSIADGVQADPATFEYAAPISYEGWGSMLVALTPWTDEHTPEVLGAVRPAGVVRVSMLVPRPDDIAQLERCWFAWYPPTGDVAVRGTAVLLPGMFGTPRWIIEGWTRDLNARGWLVLRMLTQPSRFTERRRYDIEGGIDQAAKAVAAHFDRRLGSSARAVKVACEHVEGETAELADLPRIAIGLSGGGIMLPTVVAAEPERYDAAVVLAGGADLVTIIETSNYTAFIDAVRFRRGDRRLLEWERTQLSKAYRATSDNDPYHAATRMRDVRTLIVQGTRDRAVPAETSDLLWQRMGEPDRWLWPAGHEVLALALQSRFGEVLDWVDGVVGRGEHDPDTLGDPNAGGPP